MKGIIKKQLGLVSYEVRTDEGLWKCHTDQMKSDNASKDHGDCVGYKLDITTTETMNAPNITYKMNTPSGFSPLQEVMNSSSNQQLLQPRYPKRQRNPPS